MTNTVIAFFGLILWALALLSTLVGLRVYHTLVKGRPANKFAPTGEDVSIFSQRLVRTHANCYENIPYFLAILIYAIATDQTAVTDALALYLLGARILQSVIHILSTHPHAVSIRFAFFLAQLGIAGYWALAFIDVV